METIILVGSVALLVLTVWLSKTLNGYSKKQYGHAPIGLGTIFFGMIPYILLIIGFLLRDNNPVALPIVILLASVSTTVLFLWIMNRSSAMIATGAIILLTIFGLPTALFLFFSPRDNENI